jgi:hypothetical protein
MSQGASDQSLWTPRTLGRPLGLLPLRLLLLLLPAKAVYCLLQLVCLDYAVLSEQARDSRCGTYNTTALTL